jgi:hypothetical protein
MSVCGDLRRRLSSPTKARRSLAESWFAPSLCRGEPKLCSRPPLMAPIQSPSTCTEPVMPLSDGAGAASTAARQTSGPNVVGRRYEFRYDRRRPRPLDGRYGTPGELRRSSRHDCVQPRDAASRRGTPQAPAAYGADTARRRPVAEKRQRRLNPALLMALSSSGE